LAIAAINVFAAWTIIFAPSHEAAQVERHKPYASAPLYQLSPIPAGADWGGS
jgi:hypothetical protein